MRLETLKDRIANAELKLEKKKGTIEKKSALIEKKKAKLQKMGYDFDVDDRYVARDKNDNEAFWLFCEIEHLGEDIERLIDEVDEISKSLEKYNAQMGGAEAEERVLLTEIPDSMKQLQVELVEKWDEWDKNRREFLIDKKRELGYSGFMKKFGRMDYEFTYLTDEQIHKKNLQDAKVFILDLYRRVKDITGEVTSWDGIYLDNGSNGFPALNGVVIGKEGRARVESILAGGYNIQRLHIRVLVHSF